MPKPGHEQLSVWVPEGTKVKIKALSKNKETIGEVLVRALEALEQSNQNNTDNNNKNGYESILERLERIEDHLGLSSEHITSIMKNL